MSIISEINRAKKVFGRFNRAFNDKH